MAKTNHKEELLREFFSTMEKMRRVVGKLVNFSCEDKAATVLQIQALSFLKEHPNTTVSELADFLHMSSSAIAQFTDRMVESHLVSRRHDKDDRRIVRLSITDEGKIESIMIHRRMFKKMGVVLNYVSEDDLKEMIRIHTKILNNLENIQ